MRTGGDDMAQALIPGIAGVVTSGGTVKRFARRAGSESSSATVFDVIGEPRSAWIVSVPSGMGPFAATTRAIQSATASARCGL